MKPRNFPARKLARQMAAMVRESDLDLSCNRARGVLADEFMIQEARNIRTKKRRDSAR